MLNKVLFYTCFGIGVRLWQLGIEMRPIFAWTSLRMVPVFGGVGAGFGYWIQGISDRQVAVLDARKQSLLEKRRRRAEREASEASA